MLRSEILEGISLEKNYRIPDTNANVYLKGTSEKIPLSEQLMSKHMLFVGMIGSGKTNAMFQLLDQLTTQMTEDDVMIVFDTKGDFQREFYREGTDVIISNDNTATAYWNLMKEALIDGEEQAEELLLELANTLFEEKIKRSNAPFFPTAAKDVLHGIMSFIVRSEEEISNKFLHEFITQVSVEDVIRIFENVADLKGLVDYIAGGTESGQSQGVYAELRNVCREIFIGNFRKAGDFSIREFVRNKGGKILFIEYDMSIGKVLTPIYKAMFDLAIKESLCRKKSEGNVYYIIDEFKLLPNLYHIDNGINFGRSLGAKFVIAMQNIEQIRDSYGKELANSILSGMNTVVSFRVNDQATREFIKGIYGKNRKKILYRSGIYSAGNKEELLFSDVIEDWDIARLQIGEAIVAIADHPPFLFPFAEYER
jgi:type IV secretory pathway TraG/TraD family ATPase VirD4